MPPICQIYFATRMCGIWCKKEKGVSMDANLVFLPKLVRDNNIHPYSLTEGICIEIIRNDCETQLKQIFGNNMNTQVTKIGVNITQPVSGNTTQADG